MADIETTFRILSEAIKEHRPSTIISCYSGGYDSMAMTHVVNDMVAELAPQTQYLVAAVDTLLSADGWREFVTTSAQQIGAERFEIWDNPDINLFIEDVKRYGWVYVESGHKNYFYYLKQRVFRMMLAHFKTHRHDRVMFLNGVRRAESKKRSKTKPVDVYGSAVHVNPLVFWSNWEVAQYRIDHDLPVNPFYDRWGNSGDCGCNWHNRISVEALHRWGTKASQIIDPLRQHNLETFGYDYDEKPSSLEAQERAGQERLFDWDTNCTPNLCDGCSMPEPTNKALDFVSLQRMDW